MGMSVGMVGVGGEERDFGFFGREGKSLPVSLLWYLYLGDVVCESKPRHLESSYSLFSLLRPAIKVLERLILPFLTIHLNLAETQHGFRKHRSATPCPIAAYSLGDIMF